MPALSRRRLLHAFAACALPGAGNAHAQETIAQDGMVATRWPAGKAVPALDALDLEGRRRTLADWRGRVLVLNFWASWCAPCVAELPTLARLAQAHANVDTLAVATINFKESARLVRRFIEPRALDLPVLLDTDGANAARWGVRIFPGTLVVDASGQPQWFVRGELDWTGATGAALITPFLTPKKTS